MSTHPVGEDRNREAPWSRAELWIGSAALLLLTTCGVALSVGLSPVSPSGDAMTPALKLAIYVLIAAATAGLFYWNRSPGLGAVVRRRPAASALLLTLLVLAATYIMALAYYRIIYPPGYAPPAPPSPDLLQPPLANVLTAVVAAPLVEEILFRSVLFRGFKSHYGMIGGLVISSSIFALYHFSVADALPVFVNGLATALLFDETDSLWPAILFHMGWNTLVLFRITL